MSETTMEMSPPPVTPKLLRRSSSDRIFGGVCGGLGRYWNVDPVVLRVAFGVSLLLGGFGLFAYLAMWLLVPDETAPADARISESWGLRIVGSVVAFIAAMIGLGLLFSDSVGGGGVVLGALMAAIVVWIVMSQRPSSPPVAEPEPGYAYGGSGGYTPTTMLEQPPAPPAAPRERSYLGLIGLCAAIAATGVALLLTDNPTVVLAT
ncbi:MAG: PspC domain-containing protein, partial [Candidatus Nanopelagicales bacterium]|nr:PspC domain-containing protein [Candidatus Nanopelagicales bacterium]